MVSVPFSHDSVLTLEQTPVRRELILVAPIPVASDWLGWAYDSTLLKNVI